MKTNLMICLVLISLFSPFLVHTGGQGEGEQVILDNGYSQITSSGFVLQWKVEGDILRVVVSAPTTGWIAVGFDPTRMMKDANIIIGYVKNGQVQIRGDYGIAVTAHQPDEGLGGSTDIVEASGKEEGGNTQLSFAIPLDSGDSRDRVLVPGQEYRVILSHGPDGADEFNRYHENRTEVTVKL